MEFSLNIERLLLFCLVMLLCVGCGSGRSSGGGRGGNGNGSGGDGLMMEWFVYVHNDTGYAWEGGGSTADEYPVMEAPPIMLFDELFLSGMTDWATVTFEVVAYGEQFCIAYRALDVEGDCYDWNNHGNCYITAPELTTEVVVDFSDWEGGGCPEW